MWKWFYWKENVNMPKPKTTNECLSTRCKDCEHVEENDFEIDSRTKVVINCEILRKMMREED